MQRHELSKLSREELIAHAEHLGIPRPRVLTAPELIDEIISRTEPNPRAREKARGWLGKARDLLASVVEHGLHLPEAARAIRTQAPMNKEWPNPPPPLPTVTLAEIYAAQGHLDRAMVVLDEVLARDPDHKEARSMRERLLEQSHRAKPRPSRVTDAEAAETQAAEGKTEPEAAETQAAEGKTEPEAAETQAAEGKTEPEAAETQAAEGKTEPEAAETQAAEGKTEPLAAEPPAAAQPANVDEVVAIAVEPNTIYVYWEVRAETISRAKLRHPEGRLLLRSVAMVPTWDGPVRHARDVEVDELFGDGFLRDMPSGADVRISIGWVFGEHFEPFAIGQELSLPRAEVSPAIAKQVGQFSMEGPSEHTHLESRPEGRFGVGLEPVAKAVHFTRTLVSAPVPGRPIASGGESSIRGAPQEAVITQVYVEQIVPGGEGAPEGAPARKRYFSFLKREGEGRPAFGGASEQNWGGASDLSRPWGGASDLSAKRR